MIPHILALVYILNGLIFNSIKYWKKVTCNRTKLNQRRNNKVLEALNVVTNVNSSTDYIDLLINSKYFPNFCL